jgi:hypothetical protein
VTPLGSWRAAAADRRRNSRANAVAPAEWREEPADLDDEGCSPDQLCIRGSDTAFHEYDCGDSWLRRMELVPAGGRAKTRGRPG